MLTLGDGGKTKEMTPLEKLETTMAGYGFGRSGNVEFWLKMLREADNDEKGRAGLYPETVKVLREALRVYYFGDEKM
jgi:hypothetical protein